MTFTECGTKGFSQGFVHILPRFGIDFGLYLNGSYGPTCSCKGYLERSWSSKAFSWKEISILTISHVKKSLERTFMQAFSYNLLTSAGIFPKTLYTSTLYVICLINKYGPLKYDYQKTIIMMANLAMLSYQTEFNFKVHFNSLSTSDVWCDWSLFVKGHSCYKAEFHIVLPWSTYVIQTNSAYKVWFDLDPS